MKIIKDIDQGSDEWLKLRSGIATASNFSKIITSTAKRSATLPKYALELASDMLIIEPEQGYKSTDMERGNELEEEARDAYQEQTLNLVEEVAFITCGDYGYSPDGLIDEDGLIEIKCPNKITHTQYLRDNKVPTEYIAQCQGGLMVSGRKWIDFISYHPNFSGDKRLFIKRIERDEHFIASLKIGISEAIKLRNEYLEKIN